MCKTALFSAIIITILAGCSTTLESKRLTRDDLKQPQYASQYHLKRQDFALRIERELTKCAPVVSTSILPNGGTLTETGKKTEVEIAVRTQVTPLLRADPDQRFVIPYEDLASGNKTTNLTITYYPDRTIKSINAKVEDKTAQVIAQGLKLAASTAVGIASGGLASPSAEALQALGFTADEFGQPPAPPGIVCTAQALQALEFKKETNGKIQKFKGEVKTLTESIDVWKAALAGQTDDTKAILDHIDELLAERQQANKNLKQAQRSLSEPNKLLIDITQTIFKPRWKKNTNDEYEFHMREMFELSSDRKEKWFTTGFSKKFLKGKIEDLGLRIPGEFSQSIIERLPEEVVVEYAGSDDLTEKTKVEIYLYFRELADFEEPTTLPIPVQTTLTTSDDGTVKGIVVRDPLEAELFLCATACPTTIPKLEGLIAESLSAQLAAKSKVDPKANEAAKALGLTAVTTGKAYKGRYAIPQAGPLMLLTLENQAFETSTVELAINADGRIEKFGFIDQATLPTALGAAASGTEAILSTVREIRRADIEEQKFENEKLDVRKTELELKKAIDELEDEGFE